MSNNNNNTRNIYNTTAGRSSSSVGGGGHSSSDNDEMEVLLSQSTASQHAMGNSQTTINIENDMSPGTSQQHLQRQQLLQQLRRDADATRINMDMDVTHLQSANSVDNSNLDDRQRIPNLFAMLREARHQLNRSQSLRDAHPNVTTPNGEYSTANAHPRTWRENLYEVLSSPVTPRSDVLRAIFAPVSTASVRYDSLPTNDVIPEEQFHFLLNRQNANQPECDLQPPFRSHHSSNGLETQTSSSSSALRLSRQNSRLTEDRSINENSTSAPQTPAVDISLDSNGSGGGGGSRRQSNAAASTANAARIPQRQTSATGSTTAPTIDMIDDADTNAVGEMIVKLVTHFVRYLPFIFIIFVKFIHDHLLGILDILLLHGVLYQLNKSLKEQIAKLNQKSYAVLIRDMILVVCVVTYRFILSTSTPDPFGLLINPPGATITLDLFSAQNPSPSANELASELLGKHQIEEVPALPTSNPSNSTISVAKTISLGALLYYVAVNDLILKLLTQLIKIIVTMLPTKAIRHKSRARLYALIEYISQFYRALVPMRQWLTFLFESYTGLEVISGILFSAFYMGAKGFEFVERGKPLKKALINFVRNMDYDRKPTKDELEAAGTVCPICHDTYTTPVVLECGHIFCDECVNTWFKREQTCPMCRAKVSEDPTWQDGATTYFYQLC
ncbi:hypothetical protein FF38_14022 [Lucilia cuprina]|uniref:RING-type domain-containing protein n=1 Tax=Lucilia cuprina TaxID=7375 RepID=A0A0L0CLI8_LUCCU|nr:RING finger and transmembrane domain-containing protein 2 [Lucilia cuprina]KNC32309.1 hypothetical protein FF38_14022 [Lucilia cuprina]